MAVRMVWNISKLQNSGMITKQQNDYKTAGRLQNSGLISESSIEVAPKITRKYMIKNKIDMVLVHL